MRDESSRSGQDNALSFLKDIDDAWDFEQASWDAVNHMTFTHQKKLEHPFSIKYTVDGTHVYANQEEIAKLDGDYVLNFLTQDIEGSYYLMFEKDSE